MIYPALTSQIAKHVNRQIAVSNERTVRSGAFNTDPRNEGYRKNAISEIRKALISSVEF